MDLVLSTGPTGEVITLDEAKAHMVVEHTDDDSMIRSFIQMAVDHAESITNRLFLTQTWIAYLEDFPDGEIILPYGQLQSVTSVEYRDDDGDWQTMDSAEYVVDTVREPGRVVLADGETWPTDTLYPGMSVRITFVCGYGTQARVSITGATNAAPIVVTSADHGLLTGDRIRVEDVEGTTAANGTWTVTGVDDNDFSLQGSTGNAAYTESTGDFIKIEVPEAIRAALMLMVGNAYAHRETIGVGQAFQEIPVVDRLLSNYRIWRV
jgi:uncharacterized phiE125 gp8 family phage protein